MVAPDCTPIARSASTSKPLPVDGLPPSAPPALHAGGGEPALSWEEATRLYDGYLRARRSAHTTIYAHHRAVRKLREHLGELAPHPADVVKDFPFNREGRSRKRNETERTEKNKAAGTRLLGLAKAVRPRTNGGGQRPF